MKCGDSMEGYRDHLQVCYFPTIKVTLPLLLLLLNGHNKLKGQVPDV